MASEQDWREAARGIPVWRMALTYNDPEAPGGWVVALDDPDTRAAYDRRLALAFGAPLTAVNDGVCVYRRRDGAMVVTAGAPSHDWRRRWAWASELDMEDTEDGRLLARALAWPADKRVTG